MHESGADGGNVETPNGADGEGLIDPDLFIIRSTDIDLDGVLAASSAFTGIAERVRTGVNRLPASWAPLSEPGVYETPESAQVQQLMVPAVTAGEELASSAATASTALASFSLLLSIFGRLPGRLAELEDEARQFRDDALRGAPRPPRALPALNLLDAGKSDTVHWQKNPEYARRNIDLLARYAGILATISEAACDAAATIQNIPGMPALATPVPFNADAIAASPMPWGSPREADLTFDAQIQQGVANTIVALATSLAALTGIRDGTWSPQNALRSWGDLGNSLLGTVMFTGASRMPGTAQELETMAEGLVGSDDPLAQWIGERLLDGQSMVLPLTAGLSVDLDDAAERWQREPWEVGAETALAWLQLFLPGPKVGRGVPMSPAARSMLDDMLAAADLVQTGSGWYLSSGVRVADAAGRWLGDRIYGGSGGPSGGTHMWRPGDPEPTPATGPGGAHRG